MGFSCAYPQCAPTMIFGCGDLVSFAYADERMYFAIYQALGKPSGVTVPFEMSRTLKELESGRVSSKGLVIGAIPSIRTLRSTVPS